MSRVIMVRGGSRRSVIKAGMRGAPGADGEGGGGSAGVASFNTRTGIVTLTGADVTDALGYVPADGASLATVAFSGSYPDLADKPFIPSAPGDVGAASSAQGALADTAVQPAALAVQLDLKVDKITGYGLSQENFTPAEKAKLAGLDGNLWKGEYTTLVALQSAHPTAEPGSSANVDAGIGDPVLRYIWDDNDNEWVAQAGSADPITAAQVKTLYESNPDTNAYTDAEKTKLGDIAANATANPDTDSLSEGATNKWFTEARVRAAVLTGLSMASAAAVSATDNVLAAFGKLQKQITDLIATVSGKQDTLVSATNIKTINGASVLGAGDLTVGDLANPMTTAGDVIKGGTGGTPERLAIGTAGQVLTVVGGTPAWEDLPAAGTGDVVGPASSANNGVALFDGTTGKLIKDGGTLKTLNGESLFGAGNIVIPGGAPSNLSATAWVEATTGNDSTGAIGDIAKPFLTINAALDALPSTGGRIFLSRGVHAPIHDDYAPGFTLDPASKLKSNVSFYGSGMPELNNPTNPTTLNSNSGTVIKGHLVLHSIRNNVKFFDLGVDSGLDVCTALYGGTAQEGIGWYNIGQIDALPQARGAELHNVIALCKDASAPVHAIGLENVVNPFASNIAAYLGTHGLALKAVGGIIQGVCSYGHSADVIVIKESNVGNNTAPCRNTLISNIVGGSLSPGDTPYGIWLHAASTRDLRDIVISGVTLSGVGTNEIRTSTNSTGRVRDIRIEGMVADGPIRTSMSALTNANSLFINGFPQGTLALTDAVTINTDAASHLSGGVFSVTPGAAGRTLANPTNLTIGKTYLWLVNTGSGTITTYGSLFSFLPNTAPTTSVTAGVDLLTAVYDGTKLRAVYSKP